MSSYVPGKRGGGSKYSHYHLVIYGSVQGINRGEVMRIGNWDYWQQTENIEKEHKLDKPKD